MVREVQIYEQPDARWRYGIRLRHDDGRYEWMEGYNDPAVTERKARDYAEHHDVPIDVVVESMTAHEFGLL